MSTQNPLVDKLGFVDPTSPAFDNGDEDEVREFILSLPDDHPDILKDAGIKPRHYRMNLTTAANSLGGANKVENGRRSEQWVKTQFLEKASGLTFRDTTGNTKMDFQGTFQGKKLALESKGGEGESHDHVNIPSGTDIAVMWGRLYSTKSEAPEIRLRELATRDVRTGINEKRDYGKGFDFTVIQDVVCGPTKDDVHIPQVVVYPTEYPFIDEATYDHNLHPELPDIDDLGFVKSVYETVLGVDDVDEMKEYIWLHELHLKDTSSEDDERTNLRVYKDCWNLEYPDIELPVGSAGYYHEREEDPLVKSNLPDDILQTLRE